MQCIFKACTSAKCPQEAAILSLQLMDKLVNRCRIAKEYVFRKSLHTVFKVCISTDFTVRTVAMPIVTHWILRYQIEYPQLSVLLMYMRSRGIAIPKPAADVIQEVHNKQKLANMHRFVLGDYATRIVLLRHAIKRAQRCAAEEASPTSKPTSRVVNLTGEQQWQPTLTPEQEAAKEQLRRERVWQSWTKWRPRLTRWKAHLRNDSLAREIQFLEDEFHRAADRVHDLLAVHKSSVGVATFGADGQAIVALDSDSSSGDEKYDENEKFFQQLARVQPPTPADNISESQTEPEETINQLATREERQAAFRKQTPEGALPSADDFLRELERQAKEREDSSDPTLAVDLGESIAKSSTSRQAASFSEQLSASTVTKEAGSASKPKSLLELRPKGLAFSHQFTSLLSSTNISFKNQTNQNEDEDDDDGDPFAAEKFAEVIELSSGDEADGSFPSRGSVAMSSFAMSEMRAMKVEPRDEDHRDPFSSEFEDSQMPSATGFDREQSEKSSDLVNNEAQDESEVGQSEMGHLRLGSASGTGKRRIVELDSSDDSA